MLTYKQKTKTSRLWTILATALFLLIGNVGVSWGQTAIYEITSKTAVSTIGTAPVGSSATYAQTYNNTAGQMTSGNSTTLTLSGYAGMKITSIVLSMKSNASKGAGTLSVVAGSTAISSVSPSAGFNTGSWYGSWRTNFVDVTKTPTTYDIQTGENVVITIAATQNSLYIEKYSITYEPLVGGVDVTFDGNGSTNGTMANQTAYAASDLISNTFERTGYSFSGWNTAANGSGTAYADEASFPFSANTTLYAQWVANKTVTFDANGGTGTMANQSAGVPTALTSNDFARSGYTFAGWNTVSNGSGTAYADGAYYPFTADETLYAQWDVYVGPCFEDLFTGLNGNNTASSGSSTSWYGNTNFTTTSTAYEAGNAVRLGSSSNSGSLTSSTLSSVSGDVTVSINVKGWTSVEGGLKITLNGVSETLTYTAKMADAFETVTALFTGVPANSTLIIETTAKRAFIDDVKIFCAPSSPTLTATPTSLSNLDYTVGSGPSANQTLDLSGSNLDGSNVTLTTSNTNFEISKDNSTWSTSSLTLAAYAGVAQTIYVRLKAGLTVNPYTGSIVIAGGGVLPADEITVSLSGIVSAVIAPVITSTLSQSVEYGSVVSYQINADNTPTSFSATPLPTGLTINTSTGEITGTISQDVGTFNTTISAENSGGTDTETLVWTITQKPLTVSGLSGTNKTYDGNATASISGTGSLVGVVFSDAVTLSGTPTGTFANKNVGTAKAITVTGYSLTGAKAGNYSLTQPTGITANITSKALTVSGANAQNKPYDGNTSATISGGTLSGVISPDVVTISGGGTFATANAGNGITVTPNLALGGTDAGNYTITQPTGLTANITKATPAFTTSTININVGGTYTLPGANVSSNSTGAFIYTITSNGKATLSGLIITGTAVGTETLTVNQAADANYNAGTTTVTINVTDVANGTFRTTSAGTWPSGSATWEKYTSGSWSAATPSAATTELLIIRHTVTSSNSFSASGGVGTKMRIENGGKFIDGHASTFSLLHVKDGGTFDANASGITFISTATFQVDDNGTVNVNEYASKLWDGVEAFSGLSIFNINKWRISERLFTPEDVISNHSITGAKFGKLYLQPTSFSGTGSNWTGILPSGVYILTNSDFIINNDVTQNFTFDGGDFTVGGNLIANPISSGDIAAQSQTGTKSITVNGNVIKNGTGLFRLNGSGIFTLTVNGDLIINEGTFNSLSVFTASVYSTVDLKGHFTSALGTTVTASISSNRQNPLYLFSGTIDQNVDLKGTNNIYNVQVNKSSGVVNLVTNLTVKEKLILSLGNVVTNSNLLELGESTTNKGTLSYTSGYVVGNMKRWFNGTSTGADASDLFPFGFDDSGLKNRFAKIQFTGGSPSGALTAFFVGSPMGMNSIPILTGTSNSKPDISFDITSTENQGYWDISVTNGTLSTSTYKATLLGEGFTTITDINKLVLLKRPDLATAWFVPGTSGTGAMVTYNSVAIPAVAREGISTFSHFGFGGADANPLPVTLTAFNVSCAENNNEMDILWTTASEQNSSHFTIEKSRDLISWTAVSTQEAAGNSNQEIQYKTKDLNASNGVFYYRLIQVDYNGESQIYGPISVSCENDNSTMTVYPNPSKGKFTVDISWSKANADASLQLIDLTGKVINEMDLNLNAGSTQVEFNEANLQMGTYLVRLNSVDGIGLKPVRVVVLGN